MFLYIHYYNSIYEYEPNLLDDGSRIRYDYFTEFANNYKSLNYYDNIKTYRLIKTAPNDYESVKADILNRVDN